MKITGIELQRKQKIRRNIFLDGKFAFSISFELLLKNRLEVGQNLTERKIQELIRADQIKKLIDKALKFLSYRPRSEKEVKDNLTKIRRDLEAKSETDKESFNSLVEETVKLLKSWKQIDDYEFANWWLTQRQEHKPKSVRELEVELLKKGIKREIIDHVIKKRREEKSEQFDEKIIAASLASKRIRSYKNLSEGDFKIKLGRYLARRGFSWETLKEVIDTTIKKR